MANNVFSDFQQKKLKVKSLATKAVQYGWISPDDARAINDKLDNDVLTVGVIGQMKAGKSTFLNSFVFGDSVLPSATTPMTAALSVITNGEKPKIEVEFYSKEDWEEQKNLACQKTEDYDGNRQEQDKIKAAKEIIEKSQKVAVASLLGTKKEDDLENLIEYVGADGKFVSITKSVKIYYPMEELKGVEIVDTPGFNDPVVSREQRTKEFLKRADVVVLLVYANRAFDSTDSEVILREVKRCGIGKVVIAVNKYDLLKRNDDVADLGYASLTNDAKDQLKAACKKMGSDEFYQTLAKTTPILISAQMGLLSELPMQKINESDAFSHSWKMYKDDNWFDKKEELRQLSHIDDLINAIKDIIKRGKEDFIIQKPINYIFDAGKRMLEAEERKYAESEHKIKLLSLPDDDLEEKKEDAETAERRVNNKLKGLRDDLKEVFEKRTKEGKRKLEDSLKSFKESIEKAIKEGMGRFTSDTPTINKCNEKCDDFVKTVLPRMCEDILAEAVKKAKEPLNEFIDGVEKECRRYMMDYDYRDFLKSLQRKVKVVIDDITFNKIMGGKKEDDNIAWWMIPFVSSRVLIDMVRSVVSLEEQKSNLYEEYRKQIDEKITFDVFCENMQKNSDAICDSISNYLMDNLLSPIRKQIEEVVRNKANKESELAKAEATKKSAEEAKAKLKEQIEEVEVMKADM